MRVGMRREDKNRWERRAPLTPQDVGALVREHGVEVVVQPSAGRVFTDDEYAAAGASVHEDLSGCGLVLAVKEIPAQLIRPGTAYAFFSHTIKGQPQGMPLLRAILDRGATLLDYERVVAPDGRRLIHFGRFAGLAGAVDALWAYGRRLSALGVRTPFEVLRPTWDYPGLAAALAAVGEAGAAVAAGGSGAPDGPLVIGVTGYGNVAQGALEVLDRLPVQDVSPVDLTGDFLSSAPTDRVYRCQFREGDTVASPGGGPVDVAAYQLDPRGYRSVFDRYLPRLSILVNAVYWDPRAPRLVGRADLGRAAAAAGVPARPQVIADLSCDVDGSIAATVKATTPDDPVFVYDPGTGSAHDGFAGGGVAVLAVDNLPCELPREASASFSAALTPFIPALAAMRLDVPVARLAVPGPWRPAVIAHRGELAPQYAYLGAPLATHA